jgi:bacterioferritin (cytochrome b1)
VFRIPERTVENAVLAGLLNQILRLEYSFILNYPRLAHLVKDSKTSAMIRSLGSDRVRRTNFLVASCHRLGGIPIWDFENLPDNPDPVEIFAEYLAKENLASKLYRQCAILVENEELTSKFSDLANEQEVHIKTIETVVFNIRQGAHNQELAATV